MNSSACANCGESGLIEDVDIEVIGVPEGRPLLRIRLDQYPESPWRTEQAVSPFKARVCPACGHAMLFVSQLETFRDIARKRERYLQDAATRKP